LLSLSFSGFGPTADIGTKRADCIGRRGARRAPARLRAPAFVDVEDAKAPSGNEERPRMRRNLSASSFVFSYLATTWR
jgi:hypothetical protein